MRSFQDVLYNWLTIKVVCDARPNDTAAQETCAHFEEVLTNEYEVSNLEITTDDVMYYVSCQKGEELKKNRFPRELIEVMLNQINLEPEKYENYPIKE
jgi:Fe-S oxidoreductase